MTDVLHKAAVAHIDPVCGMTVDPARAAGHVDHGGRTYYFCGTGCVERFKANPQAFLEPTPSEPAPVAPGTEFTCPMHPEIVRSGPGSCPICGMALEPRVATLDEGPNPELADMTHRLWISALLTAPILVLAMGDMVLGIGLGGRIDPRVANWIGFALATPIVLWAGWPFFQRGWASVWVRRMGTRWPRRSRRASFRKASGGTEASKPTSTLQR
jgi:P-type Cu+ transporter